MHTMEDIIEYITRKTRVAFTKRKDINVRGKKVQMTYDDMEFYRLICKKDNQSRKN